MVFAVASSFAIEISRGYISIDIGPRHLSVFMERRLSQVAPRWFEIIREPYPAGMQVLWVALGRWCISVNRGTLPREACGVGGD